MPHLPDPCGIVPTMNHLGRIAARLATDLAETASSQTSVVIDLVNGQKIVVRFRPSDDEAFLFSEDKVLEHFGCALFHISSEDEKREVASALADLLNDSIGRQRAAYTMAVEGFTYCLDAAQALQWEVAANHFKTTCVILAQLPRDALVNLEEVIGELADFIDNEGECGEDD